MPEEQVVHIDPFRPLGEEPGTGHNRWHEAIEPVVEVDPGDTVIYETRDAFDSQLNLGSTEEDVAGVNLNLVHPLTGPVYVKGAESGDLLEVEIVEIEADPWEQWGYTIQVPGFGFLRDEFPDPFIVHWRLHGTEYAESEQLPGVRIRCNPHPGVLGLAPSAELRQRAAERGGAGRARRVRPAAGTVGCRARRRVARGPGTSHYPATRDGRKYRHQAALAGHYRSAAGVRGGRTRLDRRRAFCAGRLRGLRDGARDALPCPPALWDPQG